MPDTCIIGIGAGAAIVRHVTAVHRVAAVGWVVDACEELALLALVRSVRPVNKQPHEHATIQWFTLDQAIRLDLAHPAYPQLFARCLLYRAPV